MAIIIKAAEKSEKSAFSAVFLSNTPSNKIWFVDSGASEHMCASEKGLVNIRKSSTKIIHAANGAQLKVKCAGDLNVCVNGNEITIYDVLCVPELAANLLSISRITKSGNRVCFVDDGCEIYNHNDRFLCKAKLEDGVYKLPMDVKFVLLSKQAKIDLITWHRRLGHVNFIDLKRILRSANIEFEDRNMDNFVCESCVMAKHARQPFKHKGKRASKVLEIIHSDVCGPMEQMSLGGAKYFVTFIDDFSRETAVYLMKAKSEVLDNFKAYKSRVELQCNRKIKCLRSDNGEYKSNEFG